VQKLYLVHKAQEMPDVKLERLQITDEDMVPLELLDEVITESRHKFKTKLDYWRGLIDSARAESRKKVVLSCVEADNIVR